MQPGIVALMLIKIKKMIFNSIKYLLSSSIIRSLDVINAFRYAIGGRHFDVKENRQTKYNIIA